MKTSLSWLCAIVLLVNISACGTILYPERKGQVGGRIDVGVALLDAVGLLLFFIPGVIAFAVDFTNGTIYLPSGSTVDLSPQEKEALQHDGKIDWPGVQKLVESKLAATHALPTGHWRAEPVEDHASLQRVLALHEGLHLARLD